jgi:hypothetical protein
MCDEEVQYGLVEEQRFSGLPVLSKDRRQK